MEMKTCRVRQEENARVIEFETQIDSAEEQHQPRVMGKQDNNKFMMHNTLQSAEESEGETEINNDIEEVIRNKKLCAVTDVSIAHNRMGGHCKIEDFENHAVARKEVFKK